MKKIIVICTSAFLMVLTVLCLLLPDEEISAAERRPLEQFPEMTIKSVLSGDFMDEFEEYATDQFPFREMWRSLKAKVVYGVLGQKDNNELYLSQGHLTKIEYPLNEKSVLRASAVFEEIYEKNLKEKQCKVYLSIIPDKNYYLGEEHLQMDYEKLADTMQSELPMMTYIDIWELLEADDYYKTDSHWRQEKLIDVAERLLENMGSARSLTYQVETLSEPFYGVYYGQSALKVLPDEIYYLTNNTLESFQVYDYENQKVSAVYDMEKAAGEDPYEMFLSGPISLLEIQNPEARSERELVIFRDSFGSSIAPLLAEGYAKVTLVDIRYISSSRVGSMIDFSNADVLFLYSTSVLNHSETIK